MNGKYIQLSILTLLFAGLVAVGYGEVKTNKINLGKTGGSNGLSESIRPKRSVPQIRPLRDRKLRTRIDALKKKVEKLEAKLKKRQGYTSPTLESVSIYTYFVTDADVASIMSGGTMMVFPDPFSGDIIEDFMPDSLDITTLMYDSKVYDGLSCPDCGGCILSDDHRPPPCDFHFGASMCAVSHPFYICPEMNNDKR